MLYLSTPVTPAHLARVSSREMRVRARTALSGGTQVESGLEEVVPVALVPGSWTARWAGRGGTGNPTLGTIFPPVESVARSRGFHEPDLLLVDQPYFAGIRRTLGARRTIYRPTDVYPATTGIPGIEELERVVLAEADGVVCTSGPVRRHILDLTDGGLPLRVVENGVVYEHFVRSRPSPAEYRDIPEPRAVYVGSMDDRFDRGAVVRAASSLSSCQFVLIGPPEGATDELRSAPNVHLLGPRPFDDLPAYLQHADAGLIPLSDHPANDGRSPMKLYEYLACGLPVVARRTSELGRRDVPGLRLYDGRPDFAATLEEVLSSPVAGDALRAAARSRSWKAIAGEVLEFALAL